MNFVWGQKEDILVIYCKGEFFKHLLSDTHVRVYNAGILIPTLHSCFSADDDWVSGIQAVDKKVRRFGRLRNSLYKKIMLSNA
jgi:hypothetical protein